MGGMARNTNQKEKRKRQGRRRGRVLLSQRWHFNAGSSQDADTRVACSWERALRVADLVGVIGCYCCLAKYSWVNMWNKFSWKLTEGK